MRNQQINSDGGILNKSTGELVFRLKKLLPLPTKEVLFYPSAIEWMWNYCVYLGSEESFYCNHVKDRKENYDIGFWLGYDGISFESEATVYGNEAGNYYSGSINRGSPEGKTLRLTELFNEYFEKV